MVIGQGAKPGGGGMLLGQKVSERVAAMRTLPPGIDQRSASRHPDWTGPDDLRIKIEELREATGWEKPIYVKLGATRVDHDVKLAVAAGADVVVVDGMQGGTGATQTVFIEHTGIPTLPAVRIAAEALREIGKQDEVQLVVSGGIRSGADVAKALALGADAVSIGVGALIALGCNRPTYRADGRDHDATADYAAIGTAPGYCHHCHTGLCPVGRDHPGSRAGAPPGPGDRRAVDDQLPEGAHDGAHRPGPRLRQVQRPPPRARRSRRADASRPRPWPRCRWQAPTGYLEAGRPVVSAHSAGISGRRTLEGRRFALIVERRNGLGDIRSEWWRIRPLPRYSERLLAAAAQDLALLSKGEVWVLHLREREVDRPDGHGAVRVQDQEADTRSRRRPTA